MLDFKRSLRSKGLEFAAALNRDRLLQRAEP